MNILDDFKRYLATRNLSPTTISTYCRIAHLMENFIEEKYDFRFTIEDISKLKGFMVSNWATYITKEKNYRAGTRYLYILGAGFFLKYLYNMQFVDFDLSNALPPISDFVREMKDASDPAEADTQESEDDTHAKRAYTQDEVKNMIGFYKNDSYHDSRARAVIALAVCTGLRCSEIAAMNISDVMSSDSFARVPRKGTHGKKVKVAIPDGVLPYIEDYLRHRQLKHMDMSSDAPLFVSSTGKRMDRVMLYKHISRSQKSIGCPTGVHAFRHTALTMLAKSTDAVVARDVANQKSVSVTNRYLHTSDEDKLSAVNTLAGILR